MSIIPELACAFDTKKRAPFRIALVTVKLSELVKVKSKEMAEGIHDPKEGL